MTTIRVKVDDRQVMRALRDSRSDIRRTVKRTMERSAERHILPKAKAEAPRFIAPSLVIRSSGSGARLTTRWRGKKRAIVGVLSFGGTISTPLRPRRARALKLRDGSFVMRVDGPRTIRAKRFMQKGVNRGFRRFVAQVDHDVTQMLRSRIEHARTFG